MHFTVSATAVTGEKHPHAAVHSPRRRWQGKARQSRRTVDEQKRAFLCDCVHVRTSPSCYSKATYSTGVALQLDTDCPPQRFNRTT